MDFSRKAQIIDEILTKASVRNTPRPPKRRGWWNSELIDLRKHALKLLRTFKQKGDSLSYKAYSVARAAFHKQCKAAKKSFKDMEFRQTIDILSSRGITGLFSHFKRKGSAVACPINPEKLREASQKLFACFSSPILEFIPSCLDIFNPLVAQVTLEEICQVSKTMKSKAPSLNGFSPLQIKTLIPDLGPLLRDIFNDSLANASFPLNWLESCLFYIYKKGDKHDPNNYRSISIENPFLKCFMKILQRRLYTFSEDNGLLPMFQFGFRKNHSTVSASYLLYDLAKNQFSMKKRLYACFFDFRKAFDLVDRSLLMVKLQLLGLPSSFCSLLFFLLKNLKLHVRDDSTVSEPFYSLNGVPQGDAISPILFSLFISDLPEYLRHCAPRLNGVPVPYILFADDLVVLAESKKELQIAIDSVESYCRNSNLSINVLKTQYMVFYNGVLPKIDRMAKLAGKQLVNTNSFAYLGFTFTTRLKFSEHGKNLCHKAKLELVHYSTSFIFTIFPSICWWMYSLFISCLFSFMASLFGFPSPVIQPKYGECSVLQMC